jgi:transposase-like protein
LDLESKENGCPVVMKHYPPEFKADAVALYESSPTPAARPASVSP